MEFGAGDQEVGVETTGGEEEEAEGGRRRRLCVCEENVGTVAGFGLWLKVGQGFRESGGCDCEGGNKNEGPSSSFY
ncbi:hypothetical protein IEQ34_007693 [Dendrobium chrysotoxum]|uniref:Uncharacterized protein n=1 Tax=Dendrobium chrysotoxum TaxID=161865 RepID=A0AAV7H1Y1_DENCH|nr:hypothetical protein IEQ34_007693 [Dendrobium chrysotoxum]